MGEMFCSILAEGDFYKEDGILKVVHRNQVIEIHPLLKPLLGEEVQIAIHFVPSENPDLTKWGGGCCNLQESGFCPAGHHKDPYRILNEHGQGVLNLDSDGRWWLQKFDGTRQTIDIGLLAGHHARLVAATVFDVEKMRDSLSPEAMEQVEGLGVKATRLQDLIGQLNQHIKES